MAKKDSGLLQQEFAEGNYDSLLMGIYVDEGRLAYQKKRYADTLKMFEKNFGKAEVEIYSAPGRSEIGGNHTDHQHGEVLAASINLDAIAVVKQRQDSLVRIISDGYPMITVNVDSLEKQDQDEGKTIALIKGVLAGVQNRGYAVGGFDAYITSDVLIGAGLSSSAAFETIIGTIVSGLYNEMQISAVEIAIIGQYAENVYFGKPCGLMDQMACSVGNLVHINFADPADPKVERVEFDLNQYGYSLCITDTKGSHSDLTPDYAAVPEEMKNVARFFGQEVLLGLDIDTLVSGIRGLRAAVGDRAVLRAIHFICENQRVGLEVDALKRGDLVSFLATLTASGDSSFKYLQNVYSNSHVQNQEMSLALALSELFLGENGACRVHGGGFAGTIQAFVKNDAVADYQKRMDAVFGEGACNVLKIRKYGGIKVLREE